MNNYDAIVIGAGPAGITSSIYLARANKSVLVLEAKAFGGQIINAYNVENYPGIKSISGSDLAMNMYEQALSLGVTFKLEKVLKVTEDKKVLTDNGEYQAKAIIIATGLENRSLGIESKYIGKGVSYCATCDGNFFKNKTVAVVGGGNTALEDALYLTNLCEKVYVIHRRDSFRGEDKLKKELDTKSNIEYILNSNIVNLYGEDILESIDVDTEGSVRNIFVNGLFIAIGKEPNNSIFDNVVDILPNGYFNDEIAPLTKTEGIYVAGDCVNKELRQLTTAVSDGALAASVAIKNMKGE